MLRDISDGSGDQERYIDAFGPAGAGAFQIIASERLSDALTCVLREPPSPLLPVGPYGHRFGDRWIRMSTAHAASMPALTPAAARLLAGVTELLEIRLSDGRRRSPPGKTAHAEWMSALTRVAAGLPAGVTELLEIRLSDGCRGPSPLGKTGYTEWMPALTPVAARLLAEATELLEIRLLDICGGSPSAR